MPNSIGLICTLLAAQGPVRATYRGTVVQEGQQTQDAGTRSITVTRVDAREPAWRVVTALQAEGLVGGDTVEFRRNDQSPLRRHAKIGDSELTLVVDSQTARGLFVVAQRVTPLNVPLGKNAFLNYYALHAALAALPIGKSWRMEASVLELNDGPAFLPLTLAVAGDEQVSVPAGTYDCWVIDVSGTTGALRVHERYWFAKEKRVVVRTVEDLGDGGAELHLDLVSLDRP